MGAVSVPSELVGSSSAGAFDSKPSNALDRDVFSAGTSASLLTIPVLEQQLKLLKKELKVKDDKLARLTEHAVMMGHHMDKLKGEVACVVHTYIRSAATMHRLVSLLMLLIERSTGTSTERSCAGKRGTPATKALPILLTLLPPSLSDYDRYLPSFLPFDDAITGQGASSESGVEAPEEAPEEASR